jgi:hypothetical protein
VATEPCPNCGHELNEAAIGCQDCGAKWSEDGEYLGAPTGGPPVVAAERRVADMTVSELQTTVFWMARAGAAAAMVALSTLGLVLAGLFD